MIVEFQTEQPIQIETEHEDLTQSEQAKLLLLTTTYTRRDLYPGVHNVTPTRRSRWAVVLNGISSWTIQVNSDEDAQLYTVYKAVDTPRGPVIPDPIIIHLEPGIYYAIGDIDHHGKIITDKIVANIPQQQDQEKPHATPTRQPVTA